MAKKNLTMAEWMTILDYALYPDDWIDVPDWLEDNAADIAVYLKAQMGAKVLMKEVDPDDPDSQAEFSDWWEMQIGSFMMAHNYEYSKKYAVLQKIYEYDQTDGSYHKEGESTYTPDETRERTANLTDERTANLTDERTADLTDERTADLSDETTYDSSNTFKPDSYVETTHTNDIVTHSERTYDDNTLAAISTDEHGGSQKVSTKSGVNGDVNSREGSDTVTHTGTDTTTHTGTDTSTHTGTDTVEHTGTDTTTITGENLTEYSEDMTVKRSPQDAIDAERRIASYSLIIDVAEAICKAVCFASWEV